MVQIFRLDANSHIGDCDPGGVSVDAALRGASGNPDTYMLSGIRCLDCVAKEIREYLPQLGRKTTNSERCVPLLLDPKILFRQRYLVQSHHVLKQVGKIHENRRGRFAMEGKNPLGDTGDPRELLLSGEKVLARDLWRIQRVFQ